MNIDQSQLIPAHAKIEQHREATLKRIASRRYTEETRGILFQGMVINTERDSQGLINGAVVSSLLDTTYICNWKTPTGFVQLNADALKAIGMAVRAHVQACFDREGVLVAAVDNTTYTEAMLNLGWPE